MKFKLNKGDFVQVVNGKDRGKTGRVVKVFPEEGRILVEGINFVKRHTKPKSVDKKGGIIQIEKPVSISNVMYFCGKCRKPARISSKVLKDGSKIRYCQKCNENIEVK
ncbi:MAG TPA: 50S ribosomal protein L24 [bacterium]|nr:50S ribosomal protein L24 [bacterium]